MNPVGSERWFRALPQQGRFGRGPDGTGGTAFGTSAPAFVLAGALSCAQEFAPRVWDVSATDGPHGAPTSSGLSLWLVSGAVQSRLRTPTRLAPKQRVGVRTRARLVYGGMNDNARFPAPSGKSGPRLWMALRGRSGLAFVGRPPPSIAGADQHAQANGGKHEPGVVSKRFLTCSTGRKRSPAGVPA